jgi:Spy/CpxP family protein refolding chaperone
MKILTALRAASCAALALIALAVTPAPAWADSPDAANAVRIEDARQAPLFGDTDLSDAQALCIEECAADRNYCLGDREGPRPSACHNVYHACVSRCRYDFP